MAFIRYYFLKKALCLTGFYFNNHNAYKVIIIIVIIIITITIITMVMIIIITM